MSDVVRVGLLSAVMLLGLLGAVAVAGADPIDQNLLRNAGFEQGLTYWSNPDGHATTRTANPSAHGGTYYLMGADDTAPTSFTYQYVELLGVGFSAALIDSGYLRVEYGGWQASYQNQDRGLVSLVVENGSHQSLGSYNNGWVTTNHTWRSVGGIAVVAPGTRYLRYGFNAQRYAGSNTDGYLDDAWLIVRDTTPPPPPPPEPDPVPEPATFGLLLVALAGGLVHRRRRGAA